jgi:hypothetical protein
MIALAFFLSPLSFPLMVKEPEGVSVDDFREASKLCTYRQPR